MVSAAKVERTRGSHGERFPGCGRLRQLARKTQGEKNVIDGYRRYLVFQFPKASLILQAAQRVRSHP